ncbi:MAG: cyclic nucleotide-binding domain-containing protein [Syntrophobacteraceae bacterium]
MPEKADIFGRKPGRNPAQALEITVYRNGGEVLQEGEESPYFFVILSGRVRLSHSGKKIRILGEQDIFGLENLVFRKPSQYTVLALDKCRIAKYGPEALDHLIRNSPRMVQSLLMSTLHQLTQTTFFLLDNPEALEEARVGFFSDGETVLDEGSSSTEFYRLVSTHGGLQVTMHGKEIARIEKPGEFFGWMAGLFELPRQATVTSVGESVVEIYNCDDLELLIRDHPDVARRMMRAMMLHFAKSNSRPAGSGAADDPVSGE